MQNKFLIFNFQFLNRTARLLLLSSAIVLLAAGCNSSSSQNTQQVAEENPSIQFSQKVEGDMGDQPFNIYVSENKTALDILKMGHTVETASSTGAGELVESINGTKAEAGKEQWALYVNGRLISAGAETYKPVNGDKLEWKLEKIK